MNLRNILRLLIILACARAVLCQAAPVRSDNLTSTLQTPHFTVRYDPEDPYLARLMAKTADQELARISAYLGYSTSNMQPFVLHIYRSHREFIEAGGLQERKYTVGTARMNDQSIAVDASGAFVTAQEVIAHEITHAVIFRILREFSPALPLWFNEGVAKYLSEQYSDADDLMIADAAANGVLIPLTALQEQFPENREVLAYAESYSAIRYMIREYGKAAPRKVLEEMKKTGSFDDALTAVTGRTTDQFADEWYTSTAGKYRFLRVAKIAGAIGGVAMAMLAVAAFAVRRKRMREAAKAWEQEQFEEALRRQLGNDWWR